MRTSPLILTVSRTTEIFLAKATKGFYIIANKSPDKAGNRAYVQLLNARRKITNNESDNMIYWIH